MKNLHIQFLPSNTVQEAFLIDVREPDEVIQGSIPSSVNLPLSQMPSVWHTPAEEWQPKFGWPKPKPSQEIVFYCRSGKRSASASDIAQKNGFTKYVFLSNSSTLVFFNPTYSVFNYEGSWLDWTSREQGKSS